MIRGHLLIVGTMNIDGEQLTGCFVECSVGELRNIRADLYRDVEIRASEQGELTMQSAAAGGRDKPDLHGGPTAAVPIASVVRRPPLADSAQQPLPDTVRRCSTCIRDCKGHSSCTQDDYYNWQSA
jgi:hypothetical protein